MAAPQRRIRSERPRPVHTPASPVTPPARVVTPPPDPSAKPGPTPAGTTASAPIAEVVAAVAAAAEGWRDALTVSIGRASALSGLEAHQIRYYESLGVLSPAKTAERAGASRLYTIADLRRLHALALLTRSGHRPADAAAIVSANVAAIETGDTRTLPSLLDAERGAVADGFLIARFSSQLMDAAQAALDACLGPGAARVREMFLLVPGSPAAAVVDARRFATLPPAELGPRLRAALGGVLVAQRHHERDSLLEHIPLPLLAGTGRDDRTTIIFSADQRALPPDEGLRFCRFTHPAHPERAALFAVAVNPEVSLAATLQPESPALAATMAAGLTLCTDLLPTFARATAPRGYRYRSDGFELAQTRDSYQLLLRSLRKVIFPEDESSQGIVGTAAPGQPLHQAVFHEGESSMAALLAPDSLDQPVSLSILAHDGYNKDLAYKARLDLRGESYGLCGRAYLLREPFLSLNPGHDSRAVFAVEEGAQVALALPLIAGWGLSPFGVLYLASRREKHALGGDLAFAGMLIADALSELLGRWWLTRLRRARDERLLRSADHIARWIESLDEHSPNVAQAIDQVVAIWSRAEAARTPGRERVVTLALLDIDHYRKRIQARKVDLLPMQAQRHVRAAIERVLPGVKDYWFKHDHALLILDGYDERRAVDVLERIALQVRSEPLVVEAPQGQKAHITVNAAAKVLSYQNLRDLDPCGSDALRERVRALIDHLRDRTRALPPDKVYVL